MIQSETNAIRKLISQVQKLTTKKIFATRSSMMSFFHYFHLISRLSKFLLLYTLVAYVFPFIDLNIKCQLAIERRLI